VLGTLFCTFFFFFFRLKNMKKSISFSLSHNFRVLGPTKCVS
jgi:hypothetical protein